MVCVDYRVVFGGAYAPNRFERISTLVVAHAQRLHEVFDAAQPPPRAVQAWSRDRAAAVRNGRLPPGRAQHGSRHLQVFIDDAFDDPVVAPPEVADIIIDPVHTEALGGRPAAPYTRVHVHACLTVLVLRQLGLWAAPHKVVVGDPIVALGMLIRRPI